MNTFSDDLKEAISGELRGDGTKLFFGFYYDIISSVDDRMKNNAFYIVSIVFSTTVVTCLIFNLLFVIFLCISKNKLLQKPFFLIICHLSIGNIIVSLSILITNVPPSFMEQREVEKYLQTMVCRVIRNICIIGDELILWTVGLVSLQRVTVFIFPRFNTNFFEKKLWTTMFIFYFVVIMTSLALFWSQCSMEFSTGFRSFEFTCNGFTSTKEGLRKMYMVYMSRNLSIPIIILLFYCIIIHNIISQRRRHQLPSTNNIEVNVLKQALVLSILYMLATSVTLVAMNGTFGILDAFVIIRLTKVLDLAAGTASPLILFISNTEVRQMISDLKQFQVVVIIRRITSIPSKTSTQVSMH